jgi:hypothetical protein
MQQPATTRPQRPAIVDPTHDRRPMRPAMPVDSRLFGGWGVRF